MKKLEAVGELTKIKDDRLGMKFHRAVFGRLGDQSNAELFHLYIELVNEYWNDKPTPRFVKSRTELGNFGAITEKIGAICAEEMLKGNAELFRDVASLLEYSPPPRSKPDKPFKVPPASPAYLAAYAFLSKKPRQDKYARDELRRGIEKYLRQHGHATHLSDSTLTRVIDAYRLKVSKKRPGRKATSAGAPKAHTHAVKLNNAHTLR